MLLMWEAMLCTQHEGHMVAVHSTSACAGAWDTAMCSSNLDAQSLHYHVLRHVPQSW
jgi:hypothetical protein